MEFCSDNCVTPGYMEKALEWIERTDLCDTDAFQTCSWDDPGGYWFTGGCSNVARLTSSKVVNQILQVGTLYDLRIDSRIDAPSPEGSRR